MPLAALLAVQIAAATPAFDPRQHRDAIAGKPNEVLVLGTPHLAQLPKPLDPAFVTPLVDRLAAFRPDIITIEALSAEQCDTLERFKSAHGEAFDTYCLDLSKVEKSTGMTAPAASEQIDKALAAWPKSPTAADRRRLAMLFLAAGDNSSAAVQWLRLPQAERRAGDGLDAALVAKLDRIAKSPNENISIGATLAARLGLERVYPVDDHTADAPEAPGFGDAIQKVWGAKPVPAFKVEYDRRHANIGSAGDLLAFYRFLNAPETQRASIGHDMGAAGRIAEAQPFGRQYLAWWETRNLRMVANIRAAMTPTPGARVLSIVGSTHKGYFDAYLAMIQDVRIVDVAPFLR